MKLTFRLALTQPKQCTAYQSPAGTTVSRNCPTEFSIKNLLRWSARLAALLALASLTASAAEFFVSLNGSSGGSGSATSPWDLQTALNHPSVVKAGDTIWLRGGTYRGHFTSRLTGQSGAPIIVRQYSGERVIIDGNGSENNTLTVQGAWAIYWGFEVMNSNPNRPNVHWSRPAGITVNGPNTKFINLIVHDAGQGFGAWIPSADSEIYGCLIYNNGNSKYDHGIYSQNQTGTKRIKDNIIFNNYGRGLHVYGSNASYLNGFDVEGNTIFNNGSLNPSGDAQNVIIGGLIPAERIRMAYNYTHSAYKPGSIQLGSAANNRDIVVQNNYFVDYTHIENWQTLLSTDNTMVTPTAIHQLTTAFNLPSPSQFLDRNTYFSEEIAWKPFALRSPDGTRSGDFSAWKLLTGREANSTYTKGRPQGTRVFLRPNQYEPGRANLTVYNWNRLSAVAVSLSSVLPSGARYEIRNAQDYFAAPVATGTYAGETIHLPMTGLTVARPFGLAAPEPTGPEFNAFVLLPLPALAVANTAPTLSTIANQTIDEDTRTPALAFTIGDAETPAADLSVLASSSNPTLVPTGNISLGGSGANRTVTITPAANQFGAATISISVTDGALITTKAFTLTVNSVNDRPTISSIANQTINQDTSTAPLNFTVGDAETAAGSLSLSGASSNPTLVPVSNIRFGGSGANRTVTITPAAGQSGSATISVTVSDGSLTSTTSFSLTVSPVTPSADKVYLMVEAESGMIVAPMAVYSSSVSRQGKYISSPIANAGTATYTVTIPQAGEYVIWGRVAAKDATEDSVFFSADGAEDIYDVAEGRWSFHYQWTRVNGGAPAALSPRKFVFSAGHHTIVIRGREPNTIIDALLFTNDHAFVPTN